MRWEPKYLDRSKYNLEHMPNLAPTDLLLARLKDNSISFQEFSEKFKEEMNEFEFQQELDKIRCMLDNKEDVALICCEKEPLECHRTILKLQLTKEGYDCKEW
ncbi:MAG: DUF488 domain-containing protein [Paraclostridium sp.]